MNKGDFISWIKSIRISSLLDMTKEDLASVLGENFAMMKGYFQNNPHHCYELLEHTIKTTEGIQYGDLDEFDAVELKIAALFHDVGKPEVAFEKKGRTVFYNHSRESCELAEKQLKEYNLSGCSLDRILFYIEHHDDFISYKLKAEIDGSKNPYIVPITLETVYKKILETQEECCKRKLYVPSIKDYLNLMHLCIADAKAQNAIVIQDGVIIDSKEQKLVRLNLIFQHIKDIYLAENLECDLHTHSVFSDGTDSPKELVEKAIAQGLRVIALTDHNTIDGLFEFVDVAKKSSIDAVSGVEFSTEYNNRELHLIGLFINHEHYEKVTEYLSEACLAKEESNRKLIQNLYEAGYDVDYEELVKYSSNNNINRAVVGQYLFDKGIINSVQEGFKTLLSKDKGYYIPPRRPSTIKTIRFIKSIGAIAVLAHPLLGFTMDEFEKFLPEAIEAGLDAVETRYSLFSLEQQDYLIKIVKNNQLLESGGSDYHGNGKPHIKLGKGTGSLVVPLSIYLKMIEEHQL